MGDLLNLLALLPVLGGVLPVRFVHSCSDIPSQHLDNLIARLSFLLACFLHSPPNSLYQPVNCVRFQHWFVFFLTLKHNLQIVSQSYLVVHQTVAEPVQTVFPVSLP